MSMPKRTAMIFLAAINLMNIIAGFVTELKIARGSDVMSIIPITVELTVNQVLILNFIVVVAIIFLISIVTAYLATDVPYSPIEIIKNCPGVFMLVPIIIFGIAVFNVIHAQISADKLWIILSASFYVLASAVNFGCAMTIKED
ncbi:MAG: hypothetical protein K2H13_00765 [Eubacterium sp.]|nr:hypothetical protein [Eubacterium sp.]MDE6155636.1 hypothetical protein [Eubacterium sp.]MDE6766779.1 hypothetical protein [Eubacterium sp.]